MALWNEKDSRWDNVPDADLTFSDYVTKLLRQPSTFARLAPPSTPTTPIKDMSKMEGMFGKYLKSEGTSSSAPFGYDSEGNRRDAPVSNLTDAEWAAIKQLRGEQGWNNPYDVANRKAFGTAVLGMLGGPISFARGIYKAMPYGEQADSYLRNYMIDTGLQDPNSVVSQVYGYQIPTSGGVAPVAPEPYITGGAVDYGSSGSGSYGDGAYGSEAGYSNQANSGWASSDSYSGWSPGSSTD